MEKTEAELKQTILKNAESYKAQIQALVGRVEIQDRRVEEL